MFRKITILLLLVGCCGLSGWLIRKPRAEKWNDKTPLSEVLQALGEKRPIHSIGKVDTGKASQGRQIVHEGHATTTDGRKSKQVSRYFTCTSCHNVVKEDPDITKSDPEARLDYAIKNNLPLLQGTTLFGIVNRESWYNGDYFKKYGEVVRASRDTLANAIQLCAVECSQGRRLDAWEVDAVLHYLWSIEMTLGDLGLATEDYKKLNSASGEKKELLSWLKSKYFSYSPATFVDAPADKKAGYGLQGNPAKGQAIFEKSCLHCHNYYGYTNFILDNSKLTHRMLLRKLENNNELGVYWVLRYGTKPIPGYRPYMPHYTAERLSNQQAEDLVAYIRQQAE